MNLVLAPLRLLGERLRARRDSEHEQAILRIVLSGLICVYMWVAGRELMLGLAAYFALMILLFVADCIWLAPSVPRRVIGMMADVGVTTWAMFLSGESAVGLFGLYLSFTLGSAFRYGRRYLFLCQMLSLFGFMTVVMMAPWWREHPATGWGLLLTLYMLPLYVSVLLRLQQQRASQSA